MPKEEPTGSNTFVSSENFIRIVSVAKANNSQVSQIMRIDDGYTAFCIDEAASFVITKLMSGEKPIVRASNRETAELLKKGRW